jgi:hypothetical protein
MNRRQKAILIQFVFVVIATAAAVIAMINFKDLVNRSESMRAMEHLGRIVLQYRKENGSVPPDSFVDNIKEGLEGSARLGVLQYRGQWIDFECSPDEILAYTYRNYHSLALSEGYVLLRLDGRVEWMNKKEFESLLAKRQSPVEIQMQHR